MDTLMWQQDYSVGQDLIDEQHRELFRRINIFGNALWEGHAKEILHNHLKFLAAYVVEHFQTEEGLMEKYRFDNRREHKANHDAFVAEVSTLLTRIAETGLDSPTAIAVFERSCAWTRDHVRGMDKELGQFLSNQ
jgi:hemerythrin